GWIGDDLVAGDGDHVTSGCGDILDEDEDLLVLLDSKIADALVDQARLDGRAARTVERDCDRRGLLVRKRLFKHRRSGGDRQSRPDPGGACHNRAMQADDGNRYDLPAHPVRQKAVQEYLQLQLSFVVPVLDVGAPEARATTAGMPSPI